MPREVEDVLRMAGKVYGVFGLACGVRVRV